MAKIDEVDKIEFSYEIGSNVITVNNVKKYLNIILWNKDVQYNDIKDFIVK